MTMTAILCKAIYVIINFVIISSKGFYPKPIYLDKLVNIALTNISKQIPLLSVHEKIYQEQQLMVEGLGLFQEPLTSTKLNIVNEKEYINYYTKEQMIQSSPTKPAGLIMGYGECVPASMHRSGHVMLGPVKLYNLFVTTNPSYYRVDSSTVQILNRFANDIGGSPYANIVKGYFDPYREEFLSGNFRFMDSGTVFLPVNNRTITDGDIIHLLERKFSNESGESAWPFRSDAIYTIFFSGELTYHSDKNRVTLLIDSCGFHHSFVYNNTRIKYQVIADMTGYPNYVHLAATHGSCMNYIYMSNWLQTNGRFIADLHSYNDNPAADSLVETFAHELFETMTDATNGGWRAKFPSCLECADVCSSFYGLQANPLWNLKLGDHKYLVAGKYSPVTDRCVMAAP